MTSTHSASNKIEPEQQSTLSPLCGQSIMSGAFVRSRALGAYIKKYDVPMQYTNWWKKLHPVEAEASCSVVVAPLCERAPG